MDDDVVETRLSDGERDAAVARLSEAMSEGRLDVSEFESRSRQAYSATVPSELSPLFDDLPNADRLPAPPTASPAVATPRSTAVPAEAPSRRWFVSLFGDSRIGGRWDPRDQTVAIKLFGDNVFDVSGIGDQGMDLVAISIFGDTKLTVGDRHDVDATSFSVFGDFQDRAGVSVGPDPSMVRIRHFALFGDLKLRRG